MTPIDESPSVRGDILDKKPPTRRGPLAIVAVAVLAAVLLVLPVFSTLQPGYYQRYPGVRDSVDQWRESTHGRMTCAGCHVDPGASGFLSFAARSVPAFYSQLVRGAEKNNLLRAPDNVACQKCHTSYRQVSPDGDLLIPHRAHVEILKIRCASCHRKLVHTSNVHGANRPKMTMCLDRCHDGKRATNKCVKCHTRKHVPESHSRPDWLKVHSTESKKIDCGRCHAWAPDFCKRCHKNRPSTHAGNWKKRHSIRASKSSKGCMFCHEASFCKRCH